MFFEGGVIADSYARSGHDHRLMDKVWMRSFVGESLSCSLQGGMHAAWAGTQSFLQSRQTTFYFIEEILLPACQLVREAIDTLRPDGQYMLEAKGSLSHLG